MDECFPDLLEIPNPLVKIENVRRIKNINSFHINIKTHSEWHWINFGGGIYSNNMSFT